MSNTFDVDSINEQLLENFRSQTDPLADNTISKIVSSGEKERVNQVMKLLFTNESFHKGMFSTLGEELSNILDEYIQSTSKLPDWADASKIKNGEKLFSLYGPAIFMLLNVSSLPMCYTCAKGAQVLYETGRLLTHKGNIDPLARRLMETAQMVVNVLSNGGLAENGKGIVTVQKVRLIHASIRYYLKQGQYQGEKWDTSTFGEPINQEDLAGTLMSFGPVILAGMKQLNIEVSEAQQADYMHCWKVVGYLMGIDGRLLPDSFEDGFELATRILEHQAEASEAGEALTNSCIQFMNVLIPGNLFDDVPAYFIRYFLEDFTISSGKDLSPCIGLPKEDSVKDRIVLKLTKMITGEFSHLEERKIVQEISSHFNKRLLEGIIHHYNEGKDVQFFIPPSLQEDWGLVSQWENKASTPSILNNRLAWQTKK